MNEAEQRAAAARAEAKDAGKEAANAERFADTLDRAAEGSVGQLGRVSAAGTSSATTKFWNHRVKDADALISSLGPLGPHLTNDAIQSAIGVAKRAAVASGTIADLIVPGVEFFEDSRTVARAAPAARAKA
jgi:hypothetical protein